MMTDKTIEQVPLTISGQKLLIWATNPAVGDALQKSMQLEPPAEIMQTIPTDAVIEDADIILLLSQSPTEALCHALESGMAPDSARALVLNETLKVLGLQRRNRKRVVLMDQSVVRQDPDALLTFLGITAQTPAVEALQTAAGEGPTDFILMLARVAIQADPALSRAAGEFFAAARELNSNLKNQSDRDLAMQAISKEYQNAEETALLRDQLRLTFEQSEQSALAHTEAEATILELKTELAKKTQDMTALNEATAATKQQVAEETTLLRDQLRMMYEQLESVYKDKQTVEQRLVQTNSGLESFQQQVRTLELEISILKGRISKKDEMLQDADRRISELETINDHKSQHIVQLEANLHQFFQSRSYRITAPLRALRRLLVGESRR